MADLIVLITAYKGHLVISGPPREFEHPDWEPLRPGKIGCVLNNTSKNLGVSKEAFDFLTSVKASNDDIGDVMWWETPTGSHIFAWLGHSRCIKKPGADGQRLWKVYRDGYVLIPNDVPEPARAVLDAQGDA